MEYKEKFNNILCYLNKCGMSEETAIKKASELLESGDCSSLSLTETSWSLDCGMSKYNQ